VKYRFLCPDGCGVVPMIYLGYQHKPYQAHRYKCPKCGVTVIANSPKTKRRTAMKRIIMKRGNHLPCVSWTSEIQAIIKSGKK